MTLSEAQEFVSGIDALLEQGRRARETVRHAAAGEGDAQSVGAQGVVSVAATDGDDWSSQRSIQYDQAVVNRWKTDCLRLLRHHLGAESEPYRAFGDLVERAGVLWRAIEPGMALLSGLRAQHASGDAGAA